MKVVPYEKKYKEKYIELNKHWITTMFHLEPQDEFELYDVEKDIKKGAEIFFTLNDSGDVMACCMIKPLDGVLWELLKFAADDKYSGHGAGTACLKACIKYAEEQNAENIVLATNTKCVNAIHLYKKYGFVEVPIDRKYFPFERGNVAYELKLKNQK